MLPFGVAFGRLLKPLFADFLFHSDGTRVVCAFEGFAGVVFGFGAAFLDAVLVAMFVDGDEEWGGEGRRPVDGVNWATRGRARFSRGFRNIEKGKKMLT